MCADLFASFCDTFTPAVPAILSISKSINVILWSMLYSYSLIRHTISKAITPASPQSAGSKVCRGPELCGWWISTPPLRDPAWFQSVWLAVEGKAINQKNTKNTLAREQTQEATIHKYFCVHACVLQRQLCYCCFFVVLYFGCSAHMYSMCILWTLPRLLVLTLNRAKYISSSAILRPTQLLTPKPNGIEPKAFVLTPWPRSHLSGKKWCGSGNVSSSWPMA